MRSARSQSHARERCPNPSVQRRHNVRCDPVATLPNYKDFWIAAMHYRSRYQGVRLLSVFIHVRILLSLHQLSNARRLEPKRGFVSGAILHQNSVLSLVE